MRVLLTDDSKTIRTILCGLLNQVGIMDVTEAADGDECLAALKESRFDILLIDIHMPKLDGLAVLEIIRKESANREMPVIFISSDTDPRRMRRAKDLGAFGFIKKPFRVLGLKRAIEAATTEIREQKAVGQGGVQVAASQAGDGSWLKKIFGR